MPKQSATVENALRRLLTRLAGIKKKATGNVLRTLHNVESRLWTAVGDMRPTGKPTEQTLRRQLRRLEARRQAREKAKAKM